MTPDVLDELLAASALGVLDPAAEDGLKREVARDGAVQRRRDELARTVAALDELLATAPPPELRSGLLGAAAGRAPRLVEPAGIGELFSRQIDALGELLDELDGDEWALPAPPYGWSVHGLVAHLMVIEAYTAARLGLVDDGPAEDHHVAMGADLMAVELREEPRFTAQRWLDRARATARVVSGDLATLPSTVTLHGWPLDLDGAIIVRSFELWTHADDIRRATGRALVTPEAGDLRTISAFSVRSLPLTLPLVAPDLELAPMRVVLTGPGGATFDVGVSGVEGASTVLVADVVDYCKVAARRIHFDEVDCVIEGDEAIARALLASASMFAV